MEVRGSNGAFYKVSGVSTARLKVRLGQNRLRRARIIGAQLSPSQLAAGLERFDRVGLASFG